MSPEPAPAKTAKEEALSDTGRILSLTDGIFAFAMTLLVLSLVVPSASCTPVPPATSCTLNVASFSPNLWGILRGDSGQFFAYVLAFVVISVWWSLHHSVFGFIKRYDSVLLWMNLMFLLGIAVTPFVLGVRSTFSNTAAANELYGGAQTLVGGLLCVIVFYATDRHRLVDPKMSAEEIREQKFRAVYLTIAFAGTVPVAFVYVPASQVAFGVILGFLYLLRVRRKRREARLPPEAQRLPLAGVRRPRP
jgi:uncharacterized membrane protein